MVQFPFPIDKCSEYSFNCDDNINQSFDESYNDPLKANGLCPLTTNEIRSLLNLENDYRITNEIHPMEKINSIPEKFLSSASKRIFLITSSFITSLLLIFLAKLIPAFLTK